MIMPVRSVCADSRTCLHWRRFPCQRWGGVGAMPIVGAHLINKGSFDQQITAQIYNSGSLLVGPNTWQGAGVYAYYVENLPVAYRRSPFVVFEAHATRGRI